MTVYFAASGDYIKVGFSINVLQRTASLQGDYCNRPGDLSRDAHVEVLGWFPGTKRDELLAHAALNDHWAAGEWYLDHPDVHDYLAAQPDALITSELSARAMFAVLAGLSIADAKAMHPILVPVGDPR